MYYNSSSKSPLFISFCSYWLNSRTDQVPDFQMNNQNPLKIKFKKLDLYAGQTLFNHYTSLCQSDHYFSDKEHLRNWVS